MQNPIFTCKRLRGVCEGMEEGYRGSKIDGGDRGKQVLEEPKNPSQDPFGGLELSPPGHVVPKGKLHPPFFSSSSYTRLTPHFLPHHQSPSTQMKPPQCFLASCTNYRSIYLVQPEIYTQTTSDPTE